MNIRDLAEQARKEFESFTRKGEIGDLYRAKRPCPPWIAEMIFGIHEEGEFLPDDYKYEYLVDALDLIKNGMDPENPEIISDQTCSVSISSTGSIPTSNGADMSIRRPGN